MREKEEGSLGKCGAGGMGVKVWWWKEEQREDDRNKKERELRRPWRIRIIPPQGRGIKELIGLRGRMQGQGGEEKEKGGGRGYYKNVKRALQPFSRRSAGGH